MIHGNSVVRVVHIGQIDYARAMPHTRTVTSSEAKGSLGEILGSLSKDGPVQITRNGRLVAVISAPRAQKSTHPDGQLSALVTQYAAGKVTWRQIADETDASFGDVLLELARQNLELPRVCAEKRAEQLSLFQAVLKRAAH